MRIDKIGLALAFSPRMEALMAEVSRLLKIYSAQLVLVHVGPENEDAKNKVSNLLSVCGVAPSQVKILWKEGDPADCILNACKDEQIDLLVAGALRKENFIQYYLGSFGRIILRLAVCSVLMLVDPSVEN